MHTIGKWMAGVCAVMALAGCGDEKCDALGTHMADVVMKEAKASGVDVAEDKREQVIKKTIEACNADPPPAEHLDCALKADNTAAIKECEAEEEAAK